KGPVINDPALSGDAQHPEGAPGPTRAEGRSRAGASAAAPIDGHSGVAGFRAAATHDITSVPRPAPAALLEARGAPAAQLVWPSSILKASTIRKETACARGRWTPMIFVSRRTSMIHFSTARQRSTAS